ncbi:MAG: ATP-binding protein [Candidatus Omnitrophota bacterium]
MHPMIIGGLISWLFNLTIGLFVFFKNPKREVNRKFAFLSICIGSWSFGSFLLNTIPNRIVGIWALRFSYLFAVFLLPAFLNFVYAIIQEPINKKIKLASYTFSAFLFFLLPTKWFIKAIYILPKNGLLISSPDGIYYVFVIGFAITACIGFSKLVLAIKSSFGAKRNQLKYVLIAYFVASVAGANYFLSVFRVVKSFPIDDYILFFPFVILAYAVVKYRLMDIRVALTRAGIFAVVYTLVLGIPFGIGFRILGIGWWILPVSIMGLFASFGPFIYNHLRKRAEDLLLKEQRRYQRALRQAAKQMTRIKDLDKLCQAIVLTVVEEVKVSFAGIYLKDEEYRSYRLKHCFPKKEQTRFQEFIPLDYSLVTQLLQKKRPLLSEEIGYQDKIQLDSGLVIPCFMEEDNLLGFLVMGAKPNHQMYTPDDLVIFETLSYSTSLAIENSQFFKELEEHQRQQRIAEMDLFSYSVAHEIDNPMSVIKGHVELIKMNLLALNLPQERLNELWVSLDFIREAQERTSSMLKAIEEYGKPTTRELKPLKIEAVIDAFLKLYSAQFKHHGVYFTQELSKDLPYIRGSKQELMQVLVNLANNSLHALLQTKEKRITLRIETPNQDFIRMVFSDNGYGISKEKLSSIFAPFTTTKASTEGRGKDRTSQFLRVMLN